MNVSQNDLTHCKPLIYFMKSFVLLFLMLTFISGCPAFSQANGHPKTEQEIKDLLCHKWKLTVSESGGKKMAMTPQTGEVYLLFKSDGTIIETDDGKDSQGTWSYNHKTMTFITNDKDGIQKHTIARISKTAFVYKDSIGGMKITWTLIRLD